jgi:hypothetical protein
MQDEVNGKKPGKDGLFYGSFCNIGYLNQNKYG